MDLWQTLDSARSALVHANVKSDVEWIVGIIRGGESFVRHGDPFEFSCTVIRTGDSCEIRGFSGEMSIAAARSIRASLKAAGIKTAHWERLKSGLVKPVSAQ